MEVFSDWDYTFSEMGLSVQQADLSFDEVITVQQADSDSATEYRFAKEQYAPGVGLIYREWFIADSQCNYCCGGVTSPSCQSTIWEERAEEGFILKQTLLSFK